MKAITLLAAFSAALAASPLFADGPESQGFKLKLTKVAVADMAKDGYKVVESFKPEDRAVVKSERQLAMFFIDYDLPTNVSARIWLDQNCAGFGVGGRFASSPSGVYSGKGSVQRILQLDDDCHEKHVHLKSVRLSVSVVEGEDQKEVGLYVCDAPVDVVYASGELEEGDEFDVLEPLPPPPAVTTTLLPGWTEDLEGALSRAKKEGKLVLAYFLNSRQPGKEGLQSGVLDNAVLGSREFVEGAGKSYVLYMCELDDTKQSWAARGNIMTAFTYAARSYAGHRRTFSPPEVAIIAPGGERVALLDKGGWEGGAEGYLKKIDKSRKAGEEKVEEE